MIDIVAGGLSDAATHLLGFVARHGTATALLLLELPSKCIVDLGKNKKKRFGGAGNRSEDLEGVGEEIVLGVVLADFLNEEPPIIGSRGLL